MGDEKLGKLVTVAEVAERCKVRSESVLRWIHSRRIVAITLAGGHYRIPESELNKILKPVGKGASNENGKTN